MTVSGRSLKAGGVEVKARRSSERRVAKPEGMTSEVLRLLAASQPEAFPSATATMRS